MEGQDGVESVKDGSEKIEKLADFQVLVRLTRRRMLLLRPLIEHYIEKWHLLCGQKCGLLFFSRGESLRERRTGEHLASERDLKTRRFRVRSPSHPVP